MTQISEPVKKLLIAGGKTGGHVLAGIAVAEAWKKELLPQTKPPSINQIENTIRFVGSVGGMEERLVPKAGYPLSLLQIGSLNRVSFSQRVKTLLQLPLSLWHSARILRKEKPAVILGVGGYSSGPVLLMARILTGLRLINAKIAVLEQNSIPGFTNRILGRLADVVFASFPGTEKHFPNKKVIITGNPIRAAIQPLESAARDPFTLFIFGGSQGALGINTLVIEALPFLADLKPRLGWIHQTGEKDLDRVQQAYLNAGLQGRIEKFIDDMPAAYRSASLVICRSGSSTLAEIAAVGRASILIPLPTAADNHQEHNARVLSDVGAAQLFVQSGARGEDLAKQIRNFVENSSSLAVMEKKVSEFYQPLAATQIVNELLK